MINRVDLYARPAAVASSAPGTQRTGSSFADMLAEQVQVGKNVKFSAHAAQRLADRQIRLTQQDEAHIARAVDKAAAKGSRETLLLMDKMALVVSVPNRTVITAMSQQDMGDTVFTNIDSAVVVGNEPASALPERSKL